ncbi:MAG: BACON domain-containing protein [Bacteroidetes bacterium]|nr:BACON domain-containing protein [Bacteroidota bacterium]
MRKSIIIITVIISLLFTVNSLFSQESDIIILEYINDGNNKAIELYNAGSMSFYLHYYGLLYYNELDTNLVHVDTLNLNGELAPGQKYYIASNTADQTIQDKADTLVGGWFTNLETSYNLVLLKNDEPIDMVTSPQKRELPAPAKSNESEQFFYDDILPEPVQPEPASFAPAMSVKADIPTGKINVTYPIFTFKLNDYELPVTLNYRSKGVRVMDVSGWVGLGWDINTGGVIVRNMRGYPDDYHDKYYSYHWKGNWDYWGHHEKEIVGYLYEGNRYTETALKDKIRTSGSIRDELDDACFFHNSSAVYDAEPDEFAFSCGPYSGKFYFTPEGQVVVNSKSHLKVTYTRKVRDDDWEEIRSFTITAPDGVQYKFGTTEDSRESKIDYSIQSNYLFKPEDQLDYNDRVKFRDRGWYYNTAGCDNGCSSCCYHYSVPFENNKWFEATFWGSMENFERYREQKNNEHAYIYKWYLKEIITPNNNTINFDYYAGVLPIEYILSFDESFYSENWGVVTINVDNNDQSFLFSPFPFMPFASVGFSHQKLRYYPKYLLSITSSNGFSLTFNATYDRLDMPGAKRLNDIEFYYNAQKFKELEFNYLTYSSNQENEMPELRIGGTRYSNYQFRENGDTREGFMDTEDMLEASGHRLFLHSVTEYDEAENAMPAYEFTYFNSVKLPRRISRHQNAAGYLFKNSSAYRARQYSPGIYIGNDIVGSSTELEFVEDVSGSPYLGGNETERLRSGLLSEVKFPTGMKKTVNYVSDTELGNYVQSIITYEDDKIMKKDLYDFSDAKMKPYTNEEINDLGYYNTEAYNVVFGSSFACCDNPIGTQWDFLEKDYLEDVKYNIKGFRSSSSRLVNYRFDFFNNTVFKKIKIYTENDGRKELTVIANDEIKASWKDETFENANLDVSSASIGTDVSAKRYLLDVSELYNANGDQIMIEDYTSAIKLGSKVCNGIFPQRLMRYEGSDSPESKFYGGLYWNSNEWANYSNIKATEKFEGELELIKNKSFLYNNLKLKSQDFTEYSIDNTDKIVIKYSGDYNNPDVADYNRDDETKAIYYLIDKNMVNYPVEKLMYKNDKIVGGSVVTYNCYGSEAAGYKVFPSQEFKLVVEEPFIDNATNFTHSSVKWSSAQDYYYFDKDNRYELVRTYDLFDETNGNILQYHNQFGINNSFIWGYDGMFPVAQIINASYEQVAYSGFEAGFGDWESENAVFHDDGAMGEKSIEDKGSNISSIKTLPAGKYKISLWAKNVDGYSGGNITILNQSVDPILPGNTQWLFSEREITLASSQNVVLDVASGIKVDEIRLCPIDAQMTTSSYDPVKGITAKADITGRISRYFYDSFGRLKLLKDHDGNIVKRYKYHYKGEPTTNANPTAKLDISRADMIFDINEEEEVTKTFYITSNVSWNITTDMGILEITPHSGSGSQTISVTCTPHHYPDEGVIVITSGGITRTINVKYDELPEIPE